MNEGCYLQTGVCHLSSVGLRAFRPLRFETTAEQQAKHMRKRDQAKRRANAALQPLQLSKEGMLAAALAEHLRQVAPTGTVISLPMACGVIQGCDELLSQAPRPPALSGQWEPDTCTRPDAALMFFRVLHATPSSWKTLPLALILGAKVSPRAIALAPLQCFELHGGFCLASHASAGGVVLMEATVTTDFQMLREHAQVWQVVPDYPGFAFNGMSRISREFSDALQCFLVHRALPRTMHRFLAKRTDKFTSVFFDMQELGFASSVVVEGQGDDETLGWQLTEEGFKAFRVCSELCQPSPLANALPLAGKPQFIELCSIVRRRECVRSGLCLQLRLVCFLGKRDGIDMPGGVLHSDSGGRRELVLCTSPRPFAPVHS